MTAPHVLFNNKLMDFLEDLSSVIGHVPEYKVLTASAKFLSGFQKTQNQELFDRYVVEPYGEFILARDEAFLLEEGFGDASGNVVTLLKSVWTTISSADKDSIWSHFHVLMMLNIRCKERV